MAEDLEAMAELIRKALECPVCLALACRVRCCCSNGHMVCDTCYRRLEMNESPTCPMCRSPLSETIFVAAAVETALTDITKTMKTTCSYRPNGCRELVAVHDVNDHEVSCMYAPDVKCFVSTCQWAGVSSQIYDHVSSVHPTSVLPVQGNTLTIPDFGTLMDDRRRKAYLLKDERDNMMWLILFRGTRRSTRVLMMKVKSSGQRSATVTSRMTYQATTDLSQAKHSRRRLMMWDKNVIENSDAAFSASRQFIVVRAQPSNDLNVSWNIR
ncbi:uncharacterized protein LOC126845436 [Adelges cooleyi]|uniref:uncharacterized protein LOC126845436 n=1 Tax=Adelges cooleyi TaxID=133065 RepID=UPI00218081E6|nr:uncharacterized protein LOC126845436 [Adelges cooleyi]